MGLLSNYVTLKSPFFAPLHHTSSQMITTPPLGYITPDTDTPLIIYFCFLKLIKKQRYAHTHNTSLFELFFHKESRVLFKGDTATASPVSELLLGNELKL